MRRYEPTTPRLALATAAFAMTVITASLMVVLPAWIDGSGSGLASPVIAERKAGAHVVHDDASRIRVRTNVSSTPTPTRSGNS